MFGFPDRYLMRSWNWVNPAAHLIYVAPNLADVCRYDNGLLSVYTVHSRFGRSSACTALCVLPWRLRAGTGLDEMVGRTTAVASPGPLRMPTIATSVDPLLIYIEQLFDLLLLFGQQFSTLLGGAELPSQPKALSRMSKKARSADSMFRQRSSHLVLGSFS